MSTPHSCTHIKVTGVRCGAPALRGEQFCYFHQHAHRGVRKPPRSRLHPIAILEDEASIQAALMEIVNALLLNKIDLKRAELIIRALHIAVKNGRRAKFGVTAQEQVRDVPNYVDPAKTAADTYEMSKANPLDPDYEIATETADTTTTGVAHSSRFSKDGNRNDGNMSADTERSEAYSEFPPEPDLDIPYQAMAPPTDYKQLAEDRRIQAKIMEHEARDRAARIRLQRVQQEMEQARKEYEAEQSLSSHNFPKQEEVRVGTETAGTTTEPLPHSSRPSKVATDTANTTTGVAHSSRFSKGGDTTDESSTDPRGAVSHRPTRKPPTPAKPQVMRRSKPAAKSARSA